MIDHPKKRQKVDETTSYKEEVLFNSDTLSKIISYLPSVDILSLALTNKKFGVYNNDGLSLVEDSARIVVQDFATASGEERPIYEGETWLTNYHYLQTALVFDQLVGAEYVNTNDKSCVVNSRGHTWYTAFSNNIMRAGKHYASFVNGNDRNSAAIIGLMMGVIRPGQANQNATGYPLKKQFFQNFSPTHVEYSNNDIQCCLYYDTGDCYSSSWDDSDSKDYPTGSEWEGNEGFSSGDEIGMLLDLDEGTLSTVGRYRCVEGLRLPSNEERYHKVEKSSLPSKGILEEVSFR